MSSFDVGFLRPIKDTKSKSNFKPVKNMLVAKSRVWANTGATSLTGSATVTIPKGSRVFGVEVFLYVTTNTASCSASFQASFDDVATINESLGSNNVFTVPASVQGLFDKINYQGAGGANMTFGGNTANLKTMYNLTSITISVNNMTQGYNADRGCQVMVLYEPPVV